MSSISQPPVPSVFPVRSGATLGVGIGERKMGGKRGGHCSMSDVRAPFR
jgi:hypothetical protein